METSFGSLSFVKSATKHGVYGFPYVILVHRRKQFFALEGDNLLLTMASSKVISSFFYLTAMSNFEVYMFNNRGEPKAPQMLQAPSECSDEMEIAEEEVKQTAEMIERLLAEEVEHVDEKSCGERSTERAYNSNVEAGSLPASFNRRLLRQPGRKPTLELPADFARKYGDWISVQYEREGSLVGRNLQVQGIHEDSPVRTVNFICRKEGRKTGSS